MFGHDNVSVLNGGLPAWEKAGLAIADTEPTVSQNIGDKYPVPTRQDGLVKSFEQVIELAAANAGSHQIIDARPNGRFTGADPEPRAGLSSGHIPDSFSVPFQQVIDQQTGLMKSPEELRSLFAHLGLDEGKTTITSCGSGVTATILYLALEVARFGSQKAVYDGSWTEYASRADSSMILKDR